ncbi:MAG TPA: CAP domain-containing protein, partial [Gemmatimonadales bacterium]|nr:CAP domain-containing protein [Gemmatimonadales bacterium]
NKNVGYVIGENLAWGTLGAATPQAIVNAWIASPGHLANMLDTQYTETGIGVTPQVPPSRAGGESGATYAQEFGVIVD